MENDDYSIYLGETLIGVAKDVGPDQPNIVGFFEPTPEFEKVKHLFDKEYILIKSPGEWHNARNEIFALGLRLERKRTGEIIKSIPGRMPGPIFRNEIAWLHIHNSKVWWRCM
jgi:hypothetical protein